MTSRTMTGIGLVARAGSGIRGAADCVGRRIGVPGLGAFLHVSLRAWLKQAGVDHAKVSFIEAAFPRHGDLLRGGSLDAVVTADPFMSRITDSGAGDGASYHATFLPDGQPTIQYTARRDRVAKNAAAARALREAIVEAAALLAKPGNEARARAHIGKYIQLPPEVLAKAQISPLSALVTEKQLACWVGLLKDQGMLKGTLVLPTLIAR